MSELDNPEVFSEDPKPTGVFFKTEDDILRSVVASLEVTCIQKVSETTQLEQSEQPAPASCTPACLEPTSPPSYPDWDKGLPQDALELIANGRNDLKAMLGVSKSWQQAFEGSVTTLKIGAGAGLGLRLGGGPFAERFPGLVNLLLGESEIDQAELKELAGMRRLESLRLGGEVSYRGWDGKDEDWLSRELGRRQLQQHLTSAGLSHLLNLQSLEFLSLRGCGGIDDSDLEGLQGLSLTILDLAWCHSLKGPGLEHLRGLPLTRLDLSSCCQLGEIPDLQGMPLSDLNLANCPNIRSVQSLRGLPLIALGLWNSFGKRGSLSSLDGLQGMPLSFLDMSYNQGITDQTLEALLGLPLTYLRLEGCTHVSGEGLEFLKGMPLASLDLGGCADLEDASLSFLRWLPITSLELFGCQRLTEEGLRLLSGMPLQKLSLCGCSSLGGESLKHLREMPLNDLEITNIGNVDDTGIGYLSGLTDLTRLLLGTTNFRNDFQVTGWGWKLLRGLPLIDFCLVGGGKVTDVGLKYTKTIPF